MNTLAVVSSAAVVALASSAKGAIIDFTVNDNFFLCTTVGNAGFGTSDAFINVGDTVRWTWATGRGHSVTSAPDMGLFDSGILSGEGTVFTHTFMDEGDFTYICVLHGFHDPGSGEHFGMAGMITVMAVPAPGFAGLFAIGAALAMRRRRA